jgi:hypothetical protein
MGFAQRFCAADLQIGIAQRNCAAVLRSGIAHWRGAMVLARWDRLGTGGRMSTA